MEQIQIYLNSKKADKYHNGLTSDCTFYLPNISTRKTSSILITILSAQIPYSFYNVNSTNDKLVYNINGGETLTVYFTHSNYNINTLKDHIFSLLGASFTITYNSQSNKLLFVHDTYNFEFEQSSTCFELLGLSDNDHQSNSFYLRSDNVINLFTIRNLYINSDNFILNNIDAGEHNKSNIICAIPINVSYNSIISYSNPHNIYSEINSISNLTHLHIKITDQDGDTIDLNGCHFSMSLLLTINYK